MDNVSDSGKTSRIKDIAILTGFSVGTIDRVLHNRGDVASATKKKVLQAIKQLGYKPNILARALTSKKQYTFASLIPESGSGNMYWQLPLDGIHAAANELSAFHITVRNFFYQLNKENNFAVEARKIIELAPDGVILAPCLIKESFSFIEILDKSNIPCVLIDTLLPGLKDKPFIGEDAFQSGRIGAHLIDLITNDNDTILVLNIVPDIENIGHIQQRNEGFNAYLDLQKNSKKKIISKEVKSSDKLHETLSAILTSNSSLKAIFVANSKTYLIAQYLEKNKISNIRLIGYDLTDFNIQHLRKGHIDFLLSQQPVQQGHNAVMALYNWIVLGQKQDIEQTPIDIITRENLPFYKNFR